MNVLQLTRGPLAKVVMAVSIGAAGGLGTFVVAHAAASPSPTVAPDTSPTPNNSTTPGAGSTQNCPNM